MLLPRAPRFRKCVCLFSSATAFLGGLGCAMQISVSLILDTGVQGQRCFPGVMCGLLIIVCVMAKKRYGAGPRERMPSPSCAWVLLGVTEEFHPQKLSLLF